VGRSRLGLGPQRLVYIPGNLCWGPDNRGVEIETPKASRGAVWGGVSRTPGRFNQYSGGVLNGGYDEEQRIAVVVWWTAVH